MKHFFYTLSLIWALCSLCGCNKAEYADHSFRLEGEIREEDYGLKTGDAALYGIEVVHENGTPYAYGLFDDLSKAQISLNEDDRYIVRVMVVPDGLKECKGSLSNGYEDIFLLTSDGTDRKPCLLSNTFVYDRTVHFLSFRNPQESFYYRIFTGESRISSPQDVISVDMIKMFLAIRLDRSYNKDDYFHLSRILSDTGPTCEIPDGELTTRIFSVPPKDEEHTGILDFYYTFRNWGDNGEIFDKESFCFKLAMSEWAYRNGGHYPIFYYYIPFYTGGFFLIEVGGQPYKLMIPGFADNL